MTTTLTLTCGIPDHLLGAIRAEFDEMPGMRLTPEQFERLWNLDRTECRCAIDHLIEEGFLREDRRGRLLRMADVHP